MDIRAKFGLRIKVLRKEKGWSQENLALTADLDRTYVPSIESGKRNVSIVVLEKLAKAFELEISDLLKGI